MARRPNYGFMKQQKELKRQQKKAEKAEQKRLKKDAASNDAIRAAGDEDATDTNADA